MAPSRSRSTSQAIAIYEDHPLPGDEDAQLPLGGELGHDLLDDDDPFTSSELHKEGDTVIRSIETDDGVFDDSAFEDDEYRDDDDDDDDRDHDHRGHDNDDNDDNDDDDDDDNHTQRAANSFAVSHGYDRSFSSTSGIHLDEHISPHYSDEEGEEAEEAGDAPGSARYTTDKNGFLATPNSKLHELADAYIQGPGGDGFYKSPLPGRAMLNQHLRSPLSASKSHLASPLSPSPVAHRQSLLSSPTRPLGQGAPPHAATPSRPQPRGGYGSPSHSRHNSAHIPKERPVFRNPSSVRAMQMGSPPPFATPSPRSARHRRQQSQASREATPSRHPNPNKEYPLVLLHCTLAPLPSTFAFTPAVLEAVLPEEKLQDLALLKEKLGLGTTVLERGVLLPHPRDDYDLLEERVLEALELRKPRIGACGHFLRDDHTAALFHDDHDGGDDCKDECGARCPDCERHVHPSLLENGEFKRRWDVRVYAANGLMRAGAWGAAWREMEKVDVEVGIWISDSMRRRLEERARDEMQGGVASGMIAPEHLMGNVSPLPSERRFDEYLATPDTRSMHGRPMSTPQPAARPLSPGVPPPAASAAAAAAAAAAAPGMSKEERLPLSELLQNYVAHMFQQKKDVVLGALVLIMGLWLARISLNTVPASGGDLAATPSAAMGPLETTRAHGQPAVLATTAEAVYVTATVTETTTMTVSPAIPACTFESGAAEGDGMTAVPRDVASSLLESLARATSAAEVDVGVGVDVEVGLED